MSRFTAFVTGCFITVAVLIGRHGIVDLKTILWMLALLGLVFCVVVFVKVLLEEYPQQVQTLIRPLVILQSYIAVALPHIPKLPAFPMPKLIWRKRVAADWNVRSSLESTIADLGEEFDALYQKSNDLPSSLIALEAEFTALVNSFSHTPANDALGFYEVWLNELTVRFFAEVTQYAQHQEIIDQAKRDADAFQEECMTSWQPNKDRLSDYWELYGAYCALQKLLNVDNHQAALLSALVKAQSEIQAFRKDGLRNV